MVVSETCYAMPDVDVFYWTVLSPGIDNPGREELDSSSV